MNAVPSRQANPKCPKCKGTGKYPCQRCINGTPKGDKYFEQGGYTMGCAHCHDYAYRICACTNARLPNKTK